MKRIIAVCALMLFLCGCSGKEVELERALTLRQKLLTGNGCSFDAKIIADYTDVIYSFSMACRVDSLGNMDFTVLAPDSISGITGTISSTGGALTFDDQVLAFNSLADGQITPVSAPWVLINTLRSGYIHGCAQTDTGLFICIDDSYREEALQLDIYTDHSDTPIQAEILWQNRRVLSLTLTHFQFL